ncbi:MAG: 50S ribosomal protein L4 [Candidatus Marinimicrobia bacterium]|nr:50S ribosomal protein L4 [Candidatus Neomarinimicrobiota bacterium]MCF7827473.1 50S ribosomal protein L4 [Candidatus Neomarinimicrobiota bacterium]MCF7882397.1 50S ribosomal protein L4 [Candidatus Neomarinimicrobiota bacterium]
MKVEVYTAEGAKSGEQVELPANIFEATPNDHLIYQAVTTEMANRRLGSHSKKTRSEKRGGGKKPWRQKGTGRARAGTIRSPLWVGGGIAFAPKHHKYKKRMNRKAKRAARTSVLAYRAQEEKVFVIEDLKFEQPKTSRVATLLQDIGLSDEKVVILVGEIDENLYLSSRNLQNVDVVEAASASTYDMMDSDILLFTQSGLEQLVANLGQEN